MNSSDSADQLVKITLDGMEVAFKIAGEGAKNLAVMIYTIMKNKQQTKGKTRLSNMLKSGKTLKIFTIRAEDLKKFSQEAKRYGVLYCALADRKNSKIDGMVDVMVREDDASKINRISERFNFADVASIQQELEKEKQEGQVSQEKEKTKDEMFIDELLTKTEQKEEEQNQSTPSSDSKDTEEKSQLENSSDTKAEEMTNQSNKKSVRQELKEIQQTQERRGEMINIPKEKAPKHLKEISEKKNPKHLKQPKHLDPQMHRNKKTKKRERSK